MSVIVGGSKVGDCLRLKGRQKSVGRMLTSPKTPCEHESAKSCLYWKKKTFRQGGFNINNPVVGKTRRKVFRAGSKYTKPKGAIEN